MTKPQSPSAAAEGEASLPMEIVPRSLVWYRGAEEGEGEA
jgi:hypothetical protein